MKYNPAFLDDETLVRTFVVRHREFAAVMEAVRENTDEANQHVLVIGPRGSGKSTLVLRVAAEVRRDADLRERWYPVVYGEESYLVSNAGEFWLEALLQIAEQTGEARWHEAHADLLGEPDADRLARRALAQLLDFADGRGVRLLLVVENLHQLVGSQMDGDDETWALRRTLQTEPRLMLLGTATRRFDQIDDRRQALFEFFRIVDLDPLDSLDEIGDLWALAGNTDTPRAFLRPVEILTGGNPRLIRILSEFAARTSFRELMENLVHLMDEHTEYFKHHLDRLPPKERKVFVALADRWDPGTARDVAEVARVDVSLASAQLARLEARGAVRVVDQRGRAKVYQVAERLYNVYHLMRRRGQASARVKAAVRFMVRYYEGDRLVPAIRALVEEAGALEPDRRRDHYLAYAELLDWTEPGLRARIVAETRGDLEALPDVPEALRQRLAAEANPYASMPLEDLLAIDPATLSDVEAVRLLESALVGQSRTVPPPEITEALLAAGDRIITLRPDDSRAHYNRGNFLAYLRRYDEVLAAYDQAVALDLDNSKVHCKRGHALVHLRRYDEALAAYDRALVLQPDHFGAHSSRVLVLIFGLGRYDEALQSIERLPQDTSDPIHSSLITYMSVQIAASGRTAETLRVLESSRFAPEIEPLLVALRLDLGETVNVAQEVEEVAKDVLADIEAARATLREPASSGS